MKLGSIGRIVGAAVGAVLMALSPVAHAEAEAAHSLGDVEWLAGAWRGGAPGSGNDIQEHWMTPEGGVMTGMFRLVAGGAARVHEFMLLEEDDRGVAMRLRHFSAQMRPWEEEPLVFRLERAAEGELDFVQESPPAPTRLEYRLVGDALTVTLIKEREGREPSRTAFSMKRE